MSHVFELRPDIALLNKYGYDFISPLEIDSIWTPEARKKVEDDFSALTAKYNVGEHYDTILYICLVESNHADAKFQNIHSTYKEYKRVKELAQLLLIYRPGEKHRPLNIKVSSVLESVKLTDSVLIELIGELINKATEGQEVNPTIFGNSILEMTSNEDSNIISGQQRLNYAKIREYANQKIRKPGIRERNRYLTNFLFRVWNFVENETSLSTLPGVRFSDDQFNFLFQVSSLLGWLNELEFDSEIKDYMSSLFTNRLLQ